MVTSSTRGKTAVSEWEEFKLGAVAHNHIEVGAATPKIFEI